MATPIVPEILQRLLTRGVAANLLGICERTLSTLTKRGDLPAVRICGRVLYDPRDLNAFIALCKRSPFAGSPMPAGGTR